MTMLSPVAREMRRSARGSRPMPWQVGSTTVRPPCRREGLEFLDGERLVVERDVVLVDERVLPQLAEDLDADETLGEILPLRRLRRVPPAAAVVEDMLVHEGHAELSTGIGPETVITLPERTCASESSWSITAPGLSGARSGSSREDAGVEPDRHEDDRAGDDLREEGRDVHEDEAVADDGDGQRAEDACRGSCRARPCSEVPPSTTAAMTCSSKPTAALEEPEPRRAAISRPAMARGEAGERLDRGDDPVRRHADAARRLDV